MPRGGSKKGEHRGGAKQTNRRGRQLGGRRKGQRNKATVMREALELGLIRKDGEEGDTPRQVMLKAMRLHQQRALDAIDQCNQLIAEATALPESLQRQKIMDQAHQAEARFDRYMTMAVDVAYKVAQYVHPRLQAIMVKANDDPTTSASLLRQLLMQVDESMRDNVGRASPKMIEHQGLPQ